MHVTRIESLQREGNNMICALYETLTSSGLPSQHHRMISFRQMYISYHVVCRCRSVKSRHRPLMISGKRDTILAWAKDMVPNLQEAMRKFIRPSATFVSVNNCEAYDAQARRAALLLNEEFSGRKKRKREHAAQPPSLQIQSITRCNNSRDCQSTEEKSKK